MVLFTVFRCAPLRGWDDAFYLAQLVSVVADRDLILQDDLLVVPNDLPLRLRTVTSVTAEGGPRNVFSIGPAWLHSVYAWPVLLRSHRVEDLFRWLLALGSMGLLLLTILSTRALLVEFGLGDRTALLCAAAAVAWGPLALYGTRAYANAHLPSALCAAVFLLANAVWTRSRQAIHWTIACIAGAGLAITRWQDAVLVAWVFVGSAWICVARGERVRFAALLPGLAAAATIVGVQLVAFLKQFGAWFLVPQGSGFMHWTQPAVWALLASPLHGLFTWTPAFGLGLLGLAVLPRGMNNEQRRLVATLAAATVVTFYVSAAADDWWGGASYGARRLSALTPVAALGLGFLARRLGTRLALAASSLASVWAVFVLSAYLSGYEDLGAVFGGGPGVHSVSAGMASSWHGWKDAWGPLHALKPGFTLSDAPSGADRVAGLLLVIATCWLTARIWQFLRSARGQIGAIAAALSWAATWQVVLWRSPPACAANTAWLATLARREPARPVPAELRGSADVVAAILALRAGESAGGRLAAACARSGVVIPITEREVVLMLQDRDQTALAFGDLAPHPSQDQAP